MNHVPSALQLRLAIPAILAFAVMLLCSRPLLAQATDTASKPETSKPETVSVFGAATLKVPSEFERTKPRSRILEHEFRATDGDAADAPSARVTMMASGGGVGPNIKRWKGQFAGGAAEDQKVEVINVNDWKIHIVDNRGTFTETMGGGPFSGGKKVQRDNYAMTGAILENPQGRLYFVKMVGPMKVIQSNREAFLKMIKGIEAN